jgi:glycosyltransferase involved in cell wall biosynthesis
MRRLAIVSTVVPPSASGQAIVLAKLVATRPPDSYVFVATRPQSGSPVTASSGPTVLVVEPRFRSRLLDTVFLPVRVLVHALRIGNVVRTYRSDVVVGCTGDLWELPAALLAAQRARADFVAYLFDDYVHQWPSGLMRAVARRLEPLVLRHARAVVVTNETLAEAVAKRVGVVPTVVRNPGLDHVARRCAPCRGAIVYTGAIYGAHIDALRGLLAALELVRGEATLHVYTSATAEELASSGLVGRIVRHDHRPAAEMPDVHAAADVLFLPLAFEGAYDPELIRTSAPGKLGEYLGAGRPLLAHVPSGSFVERYLTTHDCGLVVTERDPAVLAKALEELLHDDELRKRLVHNARVRMEQDFALPVVLRAFGCAVGDS